MADRYGGGSSGARAREYRLTYQLRPPEKHHRFGINALALSRADGEHTLFTAGRDSVVRLWNVDGLRCNASTSRSLEGHVDWVNDVLVFIGAGGREADSPGECIVTCSSDTTLRVWDAQCRCVQLIGEHSDYVKALALVNSDTIASGSLDARVCLWDTETWRLKGECGNREGVKGSVYCLAGCTEAGANIVIAGSTDRTITVWDARSGDKVAKLKGHTDSVRCLDLHNKGTYLLSGGSDSVVRLWDLRQQRELRWYDSHTDSVWAVKASANLTWFLSGSRDGSVHHTEIDSRATSVIASAVSTGRDNMVLSLAMLQDESAVWVSNAGSSVDLWPVTTERRWRSGEDDDPERVRVMDVPPVATIPGLPGITTYIIMNNRRHVLTRDTEKSVALWDITRANVIKDYGDQDIDEVAQALMEEISVPLWFSVDIRLGSLGIKLDRIQCFKADTYAADAGLQAASDEDKVNIGEHVLRGLLRWWRASYDASRSQQALANGKQMDSGGLPPYDFPPYTQIIITEDDSPVPILQKQASQLTASDMHYLPTWVLEPVRDDMSMTNETRKMFFLLQPEAGSGMRKLTQNKLSAPGGLRLRRLVKYLVNELRENDNSPSGGANVPREDDIEIVCNGRVLSPQMTFNSVRQFVWRSPGDMELAYREKLTSARRA